MAELLRIEDLTVEFPLESGTLRAVDGLSLTVNESDAIGIVGESGSGKTVTALSIMGLLDSGAEIVKGRILFRGQDITRATEDQMVGIRGKRMGMIFQEPMTSLNPAFTVGEQVAEVYRYKMGESRSVAREHAIELFGRVKLPRPGQIFDKYPHEFSGGMRQRVMIAAALVCRPELVIADEPTTALDVTIQAQILAILQELQEEMGLALLFISHNLEVVAQLCDRVVVMYGAQVLEQGQSERLFEKPAHPYTHGLLRSIPRRGNPLHAITGNIFDLRHPPAGCRFHPRCPVSQDRCASDAPVIRNVVLGGEQREIRCHFPMIEEPSQRGGV